VFRSDCDVVVLPADDKSVRRIFLTPIFSRFDLTVVPCENQYPFGYFFLVEDWTKGVCRLEIGPVESTAEKKTYTLRIVEQLCGTSIDIPVTLV
jgi:hypothetical protein